MNNVNLLKKKRVLFIRHLALGDVLLAYPIIRDYKNKNLDSEITFLSAAPVHHIFKNDPIIDHVVHLSKINFEEFIRNFDEIYYLNYEHNRNLHYIDGYSVSTGIFPESKKLFVPVLEKEKINANKILSNKKLSGKKLVGLQAVSRSKFRSININILQNAIDQLKKNDQSLEFILFSDQKINLKNCINLSGKIPNIATEIGIIARCNYFISVDSGLLHIAQALQIPTMAIFGPTNPELVITNPGIIRILRNKKLDCLGCYHLIEKGTEALIECKRGDIACMNDLTENEIIQEFEKVQRREIDEDLLKRIEAYELYKNHIFSNLNFQSEKKEISDKYFFNLSDYQKKIKSTSITLWVLKMVFKGKFGTLFYKIKDRLFN